MLVVGLVGCVADEPEPSWGADCVDGQPTAGELCRMCAKEPDTLAWCGGRTPPNAECAEVLAGCPEEQQVAAWGECVTLFNRFVDWGRPCFDGVGPTPAQIEATCGANEPATCGGAEAPDCGRFLATCSGGSFAIGG